MGQSKIHKPGQTRSEREAEQEIESMEHTMNARCGAVLLMIDAMRRRGLTEFSFNVTGVGSANGKFSPDAPEAPELPPEEADEERRKDVERKRFGGSS